MVTKSGDRLIAAAREVADICRAESPLWVVKMEVFTFASKDEACDFRDALVDAFCAMPEAAGYGNVTRVEVDD